jgi:EAL domain-containing protein (putative c-di-GMP-specific phosphodiesterase class I)
VEFIGVAEDCGLIGAIGEQVLAMACADFARWRRQLARRRRACWQ